MGGTRNSSLWVGGRRRRFPIWVCVQRYLAVTLNLGAPGSSRREDFWGGVQWALPDTWILPVCGLVGSPPKTTTTGKSSY